MCWAAASSPLVSDVCHCVLSYTFTSAANCLRTCPGTLLPRPAGIGLATSLVSLVAVEPYTTKIMFERYDLENAAVRDNGELLCHEPEERRPRGGLVCVETQLRIWRGGSVALACVWGDHALPCPADPSLAWHRPSPPLLHLVLSVLTPFAAPPDKAKALPKQCCNPRCRTLPHVCTCSPKSNCRQDQGAVQAVWQVAWHLVPHQPHHPDRG